jgi:hypothetical protein
VSIQGISNQELSATGRVLILFAVTFATWLVLAIPAYWVAGLKGIEGLTWAAIVCSTPGIPVVWLVSQTPVSPTRVWFVISGMCVRSIAVALVVTLVWVTRPEMGWANFYGWLVGFYNIMLLAETYLSLPGRNNSTARP